MGVVYGGWDSNHPSSDYIEISISSWHQIRLVAQEVSAFQKPGRDCSCPSELSARKNFCNYSIFIEIINYVKKILIFFRIGNRPFSKFSMKRKTFVINICEYHTSLKEMCILLLTIYCTLFICDSTIHYLNDYLSYVTWIVQYITFSSVN